MRTCEDICFRKELRDGMREEDNGAARYNIGGSMDSEEFWLVGVSVGIHVYGHEMEVLSGRMVKCTECTASGEMLFLDSVARWLLMPGYQWSLLFVHAVLFFLGAAMPYRIGIACHVLPVRFPAFDFRLGV